jgi:2'-5' RNA ligase
MDIREVTYWTKQAERNRMAKKLNAYDEAAVPLRLPEEVNAAIKRLELQIYEMDHEEEIAEAERDFLAHKTLGKRRGRKRARKSNMSKKKVIRYG